MSNGAGKRAFVTGATGFLGLNLVEQLTAAGWRVAALHRPTSELKYLRRFPADPVEGDILDPDTLKRAVPEGADAVFHLAADTSVWSRHDARQTRVNVEGTANVVAAALAAGARRFVHTSTWNTYGLEQGEIDEETPQLGGASWINYNRTKYLAEEEVRRGIERGLAAVIVNPCHILGRYDRQGWARLILDLQTRWVPGVPPGSGCFCHAEQVAKAEIAAAEQGGTGRNYILGGAVASFVEVFREIGAVSGWKVPRRRVPAALFRLTGRVSAALAAITGREPLITPEAAAMVTAHPRVVTDRAERELGYRIVPLETMIADCFGWLQAEGLIKN